MLFNSFHFFAFLLVSVVVYFALPQRARWIYLLAASYYFYMCWKPEYVVLILFSTVIDYFVALRLGSETRLAVRRLLLGTTLVTNLGMLFAFKYLDFFGQSLERTLATFNVFVDIPEYRLLLPVGISFYTFQTLSYTIDVYRGLTPVERHFGIFALYVTFFPQLVAGPIERSNHLLPQLRRTTRVEYLRFTSGLRLALWGLFKKVVVADLVAPVVDTIYAAPEAYSGPMLALGTLFFALQIYCDFSGYTDIAIGVARMLGYDLLTNFRQPYFATSIRDFWQRWHITLSTWFRDYVYKPLGGSRVAQGRHYLNILVTFTISGLWHGAGWTFVVWGLLHGLYLVASNVTADLRARLRSAMGLERRPRLLQSLRVAFVFALVLLGWVFFRAESFTDALRVLGSLPRLDGFRVADLFAVGLPRFELVLAFIVSALVFVVDFLIVFRPPRFMALWAGRRFRWACYATCVLAIACFGVFDRVEFIYFQF
jgi:D-alanyl-lipoteichoic acid acyltransferase DltB (MBOAT superfamily)